jgi:hypothetical protein
VSRALAWDEHDRLNPKIVRQRRRASPIIVSTASRFRKNSTTLSVWTLMTPYRTDAKLKGWHLPLARFGASPDPKTAGTLAPRASACSWDTKITALQWS